MPPKFGTSGLRGLSVELTDALVADYTAAFLRACETGTGLFVGRDLRDSSPRISQAVMATAAAMDIAVTDCGVLPTPALALAAMQAGAGALMVTGSHIPADRNGLKFYTPKGEILKEHEAAINAELGHGPAPVAVTPASVDAPGAYAARYVDAFGAGALDGLRIGVYQHSSVARDIMIDVVAALGGDPVALARSEVFIPVDTEAVDAETRAMLAGWCSEHGLDAVISTDGDADRPMLTDASGTIVPGDVLGALSARRLGADVICTPVSSNTMIAAMPEFRTVTLTRIGSPFVVAAMEDALAQDPGARVVGYEANGGFLLGFEAEGPEGTLTPLMTRDCLLPILAPLVAANEAGKPLAELVAALPARFTAADRVKGIEMEVSQAFLKAMTGDPVRRAGFFDGMPAEASVDLTDGLRVTFEGGEVVHLRPSGNAPEFRCYAEAASFARAEALVTTYLAKLKSDLA